MSYLIVFLSGVLTALPFLFPKFFLLSWISVAPLLIVATKKKFAYRHGLVFGMGFYILIYYWFIKLYPMDFMGLDKGGSILLIATVWIGLSLLQAIEIAMVPFLFRHLLYSRWKWAAPFIAAASWCIFEWLQTLGWTGVPWARLAISQYQCLEMVQSASLFGSYWIGFLIILTNGFIAVFVMQYHETKAWKHYSILAAAFILILNFSFGAVRLAVTPENPYQPEITVAMIQGNIASGDKWADDSITHSIELYSDLTRKACQESGATLVLWPETVVTISLRDEPYYSQQISELAKRTGATLLIGAFDVVRSGDPESEDTYNAMLAYFPDGSLSDVVYHKRHLVPFGEYLPMADLINTLLPQLSDMNLMDDDLTAGTEPSLIQTKDGIVGGLVCFDSIYEALTLSSVREGAELIALITNDSWYRDSAAVYQHNAHAILRAIETGRYVARAANTGISSIITPTGQITESLAPLKTGYVTGTVRFTDSRTIYSYVGNLIVWVSLAFCGVLAVIKTIICVKSSKKTAEMQNNQ